MVICSIGEGVLALPHRFVHLAPISARSLATSRTAVSNAGQFFSCSGCQFEAGLHACEMRVEHGGAVFLHMLHFGCARRRRRLARGGECVEAVTATWPPLPAKRKRRKFFS